MTDPLVPHLLDILKNAPPNSFILGGGFGLLLKRQHLVHNRVLTLAESAGHVLPDARATTDIDLFLRMELFTEPASGKELRAVLDDLRYRVKEEKWQFVKPLDPLVENRELVLDLLARLPRGDENVKVRNIRVGSDSEAEIHGRKTPEAFAVDYGPVPIDVIDEGRVLGQVFVPHPYAWASMKVRAAHDWLRYTAQPWPLGDNRQPPSSKHAFDVAMIVAMITEEERDTAKQLAAQLRDEVIAAAIRHEAISLFGRADSPGWIEARRYDMFDDHELIWESLRDVLAIEAS